MKTFWIYLILSVVLIVSANAQNAPTVLPITEDNPTVTFVRKTASGAIIVEMNGTQYRLMTPAEFRQALIDREKVKNFESIQKNEAIRLAELEKKRKAEIESLVADYERNIANLKNQVANAEERASNSEEKYNKQTKVQKRTFKLTVINTLTSIATFFLRLFK